MWNGNFILNGRTLRNSLTRSGVLHILKALGAGTHQPAVTHLYVRYGAPLNTDVDVKDISATTFRDFGGAESAGCAYIPLLCPAFYTKSNLAGTFDNKIEFRFTIPYDDINEETSDGVWHSGSGFNNAPVTVYSLGVVSAQNFNDRGSDILVAASRISADGPTMQLGPGTLTPCTYTVTLEP